MNSADASRTHNDAPEDKFFVLEELTKLEKQELINWWKTQKMRVN